MSPETDSVANRPHIIIRADAGPKIGSGHAIRSLALAATFPSARKILITVAPSSFLRDEAASAGVRVLALKQPDPAPGDLLALRSVIDSGKRPWVILDGYHFDLNYQTALRRTGARILVLDDGPRLTSYDADLIVDQNIGAETRRYPGVPLERQLLGTNFALLRKSFREHAPPARRFEYPAANWLVSFGGADPAGATMVILRALSSSPSVKRVAAVVGPDNPSLHDIRMIAARDARIRVEVAADMPALMSWADAAVLGAGSSCWEAAYLGLPFVAVPIAPNQDLNAAILLSAGVAWRITLTHDEAELTARLEAFANDAIARKQLSKTGRSLVDGLGANRVVAAMDTIA